MFKPFPAEDLASWSQFNPDLLSSLGFDVGYIEKNLPDKYKKGLTPNEQKIAKREAKETMGRATDPTIKSKDLYKDWESDKSFKKRSKGVPESKATKAFKDKYGSDHAEDSGIDEALKNKAKASGISLSILREVYNRGMAAWRSGHRPGVAPQQWALGRVNSFITGSGKARKADADLWVKHKKLRKSSS